MGAERANDGHGQGGSFHIRGRPRPPLRASGPPPGRDLGLRAEPGGGRQSDDGPSLPLERPSPEPRYSRFLNAVSELSKRRCAA